MPKKRKVSSLDCPYKEMKWCLDRHMKIYAERYAIKEGRYWKEQDFYRITVEQGDRTKSTDWSYTNENIAEELIKMWIKTYNINNGKKI